MALLQELEEENKKSGLFSAMKNIRLSYPIGFPVLDHQLGAIYKYADNDGNIIIDRQLGLQAGTFSMFVGPSSSGKTTAAEQAAWEIAQSFGDDATITHIDAERSSNDPFRIRAVTGMTEYEYRTRYFLTQEIDTWEDILSQMILISKKKESDPDRYMYDTGIIDLSTGKPFRYYIPSVFIIDSLMSITSKHEDTDEISGLTAGGREAIYRGKFYRNALRYTIKYNINVIVVNHYDDEMPSIGNVGAKGKELPFIPTGKLIPGGKKAKYYTNAIILFQPLSAKDGLKTKEENGYNGVPTKTLVIKSRTSSGGMVTLQEFVQEGGFDARLTTMNLAKQMGVIAGRNPSCYFSNNPEVKFDTRKFVEEMSRDPEIIRTLYKEMKPILDDMIPVIDLTDTSNVITGTDAKRESLRDMRKLLY